MFSDFLKEWFALIEKKIKFPILLVAKIGPFYEINVLLSCLCCCKKDGHSTDNGAAPLPHLSCGSATSGAGLNHFTSSLLPLLPQLWRQVLKNRGWAYLIFLDIRCKGGLVILLSLWHSTFTCPCQTPFVLLLQLHFNLFISFLTPCLHTLPFHTPRHNNWQPFKHPSCSFIFYVCL